MISLDAGTLLVLLLAAALAGLFVGVLPPWRRLLAGEGLPVLGFLRRQRVSLDSRSLLHAELRCSVCGEQASCARRLASGEALPESCPNAALLAQSGLQNDSRPAGANPAL